MPRKLQDQWNRAVQVPSEMRAQGSDLNQTARMMKISPETVIRLVGSAFTKKRGRYMVKPTDRLLRVLVIPVRKGLQEFETRDSREASFIGQLWSAIEKYLVRGDDSGIKKLKRKHVVDAKGRRIRLLFDLNELKRLASAGVLRFESIYGRTA